MELLACHRATFSLLDTQLSEKELLTRYAERENKRRQARLHLIGITHHTTHFEATFAEEKTDGQVGESR